ncbi:MAG: TfoX/Sxy family protein [Gammaproteobacteria bacterium]|nr:TfoX/Sxy family protein [Gammaproteobacteria bacterium]
MRVERMKNISPITAMTLTAIGITTDKQLRVTGSINAYQRIKAAGFKTSLRMLFDIEAALINIHWTKLPMEVRSRLLVLADVTLDENT